MVKSEVHHRQEPPIDDEGTQPYQMRYRWVMLALIWVLYLAFGIVMRSIAPLVTPILKDLNIRECHFVVSGQPQHDRVLPEYW